MFLTQTVSFFLSISLFYRRDEQQQLESATHHRTSNMEFTLKLQVVHRQIENSYSPTSMHGTARENNTFGKSWQRCRASTHCDSKKNLRNLRIEIDRAWNAMYYCMSRADPVSRTWQFTQNFATSLLLTSYYSRFSIFTLLSSKLQNEVTVLLRWDIAKFFCASLSLIWRNISPVRTYRCYQLCRFLQCVVCWNVHQNNEFEFVN